MKSREILKNILVYANISVVAAIIFLPMYWMLATSFKPLSDIFVTPPQIVIPHFTLENYQAVLGGIQVAASGAPFPFDLFLGNTVTYLILTISITLACAVFSSYAFARFSFPGRRTLFTFILVMQMFPKAAIIIPFYNLLNSLRLIDTRLGMTVAYLIATMPLAIWMLEAFFESIPVEIEEAAMLDGCSRIQAIYRVVIPLSWPGLISAGVYTFGAVWNEFMYPLVLLPTTNLQPLSIGLMNFMGDVVVDWGKMMAASTLSILPVVILFIVLRRYFIKGLLQGAVKG